ncbi:MAG: cysteine hydrolase [Prevotella sp.]|jgi:nicotinamidase-related amidase|nr:cysteine hydrolase [Prevotella sp.]
MKKLLVVVDMQNDFIDGSLGTAEAVAIVPNVVAKINNWDGDIITTQDTHFNNYMETREGKNLPVSHCIENTDGHKINGDVFAALVKHPNHVASLNKLTFGSTALPEIIRGLGYEYIELVGLCTDICVVSNAMLLKANYPETDIAVDASCCAGVTPQTHQAALHTMNMCQIDIIGG